MFVATLYSIHRYSWKVTDDIPLVQLSYVAKVEELLVLLACPGALRCRFATFLTSLLGSGYTGE